MNFKSGAEIRREARGQMIGKYNTAAGAFVMIQLIAFALSSIASDVVDINSLYGMVAYIVMSVIINLLTVVLFVGELTIYLNMSCGNPVRSTDIFKGFRYHPDKAMILEIIVVVRELVWFVPAIAALVAGYIMGINDNDFLLICIGLTVVGAIGGLYTMITLSQTMYVLVDFPEYRIGDILKISTDIMSGRRWTYFCMMVSFLPLYLLGVLSAGIGLLFVYPYMKMSYTEFYLDTIRNSNK